MWQQVSFVFSFIQYSYADYAEQGEFTMRPVQLLDSRMLYSWLINIWRVTVDTGTYLRFRRRDNRHGDSGFHDVTGRISRS